jgi:hypothetical protein
LPVANGCKDYTSANSSGFWDMTWGTNGYKDATRCSVGGQNGICDITGQCYSYVAPQDVAEELYAIYKDFETGNILAPTYLRKQRGCAAEWDGMKRGAGMKRGLVLGISPTSTPPTNPQKNTHLQTVSKHS